MRGDRDTAFPLRGILLIVSQGLRITAIVAAYNEADIIGQTVGDLVRQRFRARAGQSLDR